MKNQTQNSREPANPFKHFFDAYNHYREETSDNAEIKKKIEDHLFEQFNKGVPPRYTGEVRHYINFFLPKEFTIPTMAKAFTVLLEKDHMKQSKKSPKGYLNYLLWLAVNRTNSITEEQAATLLQHLYPPPPKVVVDN